MPFCPRCRSEYRPGYPRCADCAIDLVAELPAPPPEPSPEGWTELFRGSTTQTDLLRAALEDAGIETLSPDDYVSTLGWYAPGGFDVIRVLVKASDLAAAREILGRRRPGD